MAAPAPTQQDVGRALRRARHRHHVQLEEAAGVTRIPRRYLEALEDNAPLDTYPAPVYARAFLREYARYLDLDPEPLLGRFGAASAEDIPLTSIRDALPPPRRWPARALLALSLSILVGLAVVGVMSGRGPLPTAGLVTHPHAAGGPPPAHHSSKPPAPPISGIKAAVHVVGRCWVVAVADGRVVVQRTIEPSEWKILHATRSLELTLGNPAGVKLVLNGRHIAVGASSRVAHLSIAFRNGNVHVTRA